MKKQIFTIGFEIPGHSEDFVDFNSKKSLMDADILLISPKSIYPDGKWVDFSSGGGGCYDVATSSKYKKNVSHFKKEIIDFLESEKNIFISLSNEVSFTLANSVSSPRKGQNTYSTYYSSNYDFLPIDIGTLISASGTHIKFSGNPVFSDFYSKFKNYLNYQIYIENPKEAQVIFTGKDKSKILGAVYKVSNGHVISLPHLEYDEDEFTEYKEEKSYWTSKAMKFGSNLINCLININQEITQESEKTPLPEWIKQKVFSTRNAISIESEIHKNEQKIEVLKNKNIQLNQDLIEEYVLRDLLFEQGKPLENAVIKALRILDYQAENYDDGDLELDQVITSPEKHRFIGECEGKDNKDINITKFRQLLESLNADFDREDVEEKAFGILFGNPQGLKAPKERTLDFTKKCKTGADREKIALVKTVDLFTVAQYLKDNNSVKYKEACRDAIYNGLGKIVEFPEIPKK